jgi:hypothetical protein
MGLYYRESRCRFRDYPNTQIIRGSSSQILRLLATEEKSGDRPLFFLDAHWYDYWPLNDELAVVKNLKKAIVMIDDFEGPGRPSFGFDVYVGRDRQGNETAHNNNLKFIERSLGRRRHHILFPDYEPKAPSDRGHIFQGRRPGVRDYKERLNSWSVLQER